MKTNRIIKLFISLFFILAQLGASANDGTLFNVVSSGTPAEVNISLCLNAKALMSCEDNPVTALDLLITPTVSNQMYPYAGILVTTPGYTINSIGIVCSLLDNGYCMFDVSSTSPKPISLNNNVTPRFAYVPDLTHTLWKCPLNSTNGSFTGGACTALTNSTSPGFDRTIDITFNAFSGVTYGYLADVTSTLWKCPMTASGGISGGACTALTNTTSPGFSQTLVATFATFSGTTYGYVADTSTHLWKCSMNSTGSFVGSACTDLTVPGIGLIADIVFAKFSGTTYIYMSDSTTELWRCTMDSMGNVSGCTPFTNATSPGFDQTADTTFGTFSGVTYAYVADESNNIWKCLMTTSGDISGGACSALTNATSPGFYRTSTLTFATISGKTYGYVADNTTHIWRCAMTASGDFTGGCTELTNGTSPGFDDTLDVTFSTF